MAAQNGRNIGFDTPSLAAVYELSKHTSDALLLVDQGFRIRLFSGAATAIFGYDESEIIGRHLDTLLPVQHRDTHEEVITAFASSGDVVRPMHDRSQVTGLTKSGEVIPLEVTIAKVTVEGGRYFGAIIRDVRERVAAMEKLEELAASRLRLIAAVSHEIRTPLTGVLGYATLLESGSLSPEETAEVASTISREAQDVTAIVEDLVVAARLELDEIRLETSDVHLLAEAQHVHNTLAAASDQPLALTGDDVTVAADPVRVRQIVRNLMVNAIRHGGPTVEVRVGRSGDMGRVDVVDDGPGPAVDTAEVMFEAFSTGRQRGGPPGSVGLGLSISRRLAQAMGGDVWFTREHDHTVFALELPLSERT